MTETEWTVGKLLDRYESYEEAPVEMTREENVRQLSELAFITHDLHYPYGRSRRLDAAVDRALRWLQMLGIDDPVGFCKGLNLGLMPDIYRYKEQGDAASYCDLLSALGDVAMEVADDAWRYLLPYSLRRFLYVALAWVAVELGAPGDLEEG